jgi:hypothetical protein
VYCLRCNYDLGGLPEPRCPECGRGFDPGDPATFRRVPRTRNEALVVIVIYLLPLLLSLWMGMTTHPTSLISWTSRFLIFVQSACGPIGCFLPSLGLAIPVALLEWGIWMVVVTQTRAREWRYRVHFCMAFAWVFVGCLPNSV